MIETFDRAPWRIAQIALPPAGLRETALRVHFMPTSQCRSQLAQAKHPAVSDMTLLQKVMAWKVGQPAQWAALIQALQFPEHGTA